MLAEVPHYLWPFHIAGGAECYCSMQKRSQFSERSFNSQWEPHTNERVCTLSICRLLISVRSHCADLSCLQADEIIISGKTTATTIIPMRARSERRVLGRSKMFGWTAVHTHSAKVETQVHRISKVPLVFGPPVQPCVSDIRSNAIYQVSEFRKSNIHWCLRFVSSKLERHCAHRWEDEKIVDHYPQFWGYI